jgi:basic membrane protein A
MKANNDIDVLFQAAYISGYGVISACADLKLPCIGVDDWQGDIDPIVFWSAIKSMDFAVTSTAEMWENKEELPPAMELNLADGGYAYADVDMKNLSPELAEAVEKLKADIISGEVDVFAGEYEEWRITNLIEGGE